MPRPVWLVNVLTREVVYMDSLQDAHRYLQGAKVHDAIGAVRKGHYIADFESHSEEEAAAAMLRYTRPSKLIRVFDIMEEKTAFFVSRAHAAAELRMSANTIRSRLLRGVETVAGSKFSISVVPYRDQKIGVWASE